MVSILFTRLLYSISYFSYQFGNIYIDKDRYHIGYTIDDFSQLLKDLPFFQIIINKIL